MLDIVNSGVLDIIISLGFTYLLFSLFTTVIQEIIATNFGFRAKILERAIYRMLEDETEFNPRFNSLLYLFKRSGSRGISNSTFVEFYKHPLIMCLGEGRFKGKPAYIKKETFSKVIIDLLRGNDFHPGDDAHFFIQKALDEKTTNWGNTKISDGTLSFLRSIWADSQGDINIFIRLLESWFVETMDRASNRYKKQTQFVLFSVGLAISLIFNVDTIKIVNKPENDTKLREQLVQQAESFEKAHPDLDKELINQKIEYQHFLARYSKEEISSNDSLWKEQLEDSLQLNKYMALQARRDTLLNRAESLINRDIRNEHHILELGWKNYKYNSLPFLIKSLIGWIITAIALSLGASFWFDLLNKLMKLRGSVATPKSDNKEKQQG